MQTFYANDADDAYEKLAGLLAFNGGQAMNVGLNILDMSEEGFLCETELFPKAALEAYTDYNLELNNDPNILATAAQVRWFSPERGGPQGDYRKGMQAKIEKVVLALKSKSTSKRAVLTVPFTDKCSLCIKTTDDVEWKCLRELYFSIGLNGRLECAGVMRSQALIIVPKNLHLIGSIMNIVAEQVGVPVGSYTHFCHYLITDRT